MWAGAWRVLTRESYLRKLEEGFARITKNPAAHKHPLPSYPGVRSIHCEHHYIFFLNTDKPIILAILHEKMDLMLRLNKILSGD